MTKFEGIESVWNNLEESYTRLGKGKTPVEFMKGLLNYDATGTGKRALLKIIRESGEASERVENLAGKIEKAYDNLEFCIQHSITVNDIREFLQNRDDTVTTDDLSVSPLSEYVSAAQLFDTGLVVPTKRIITDGGVRKVCTCVCTDYKYVCETESDVVELFHELKTSMTDNETLFGLAAFITANQLKAPLLVTNASVAEEIRKRFKVNCLKQEFNGKEYHMLEQKTEKNKCVAYVLVTEE